MTDSAAKLEQFVLLAKSARGASAAQVIINATSAPGVYVFSELLDLPPIKDLANTSHANHLALLELFAYGTFSDYKANPDSAPALSPAQLIKLKHLTLVSLALQDRSIPYATISSELGITSTREMEDLIIDVMYAGLLGGKMHHDEKILHVDWVTGRDVNPSSLPDLANALQNWSQTSRTLLTALDDQIDLVRRKNLDDASARSAYAASRSNTFFQLSNNIDPERNQRDRYPRGGGSKDSGSGWHSGPPREASAGMVGDGRFSPSPAKGEVRDDRRESKRLKSNEMEQ